jgi:hypothetical protein
MERPASGDGGGSGGGRGDRAVVSNSHGLRIKPRQVICDLSNVSIGKSDMVLQEDLIRFIRFMFCQLHHRTSLLGLPT